jgi:cyanophycin synthetase
MTTSVEKPITRETGAVIEVNAGPGLRMHSNPQEGPSRDVAGPILDMLFPIPSTARIPVIAVTGTNGKTTTTRLVAHIAKQAGFRPGYCTSDGIYLDGHQVFEGDCTGYVSARQVLFDPCIDFAVLECARGGIIRSGLGFDSCDISIITNISDDHLGMNDIESLDDLARVKSVVARTCASHGYTILNADDEQTPGLYDSLNCNIALFSLDPQNERLLAHIGNKGMAAVLEDGNVIIYNGTRTVFEKVASFPLSFGGTADFMIRNILAATLAGIISGFNHDVVKKALISFIPSPANTPGRMNEFNFGDFRVIVDYMHNPDGFREVKKFLDRLKDHPKTGIISVAGDRRDADIREVGAIAAEMFNTIIIRADKDMRGRKPEDVQALLQEGIRSKKPNVEIITILSEKDAIEHAFRTVKKNGLIFICADKVKQTLQLVKNMHQPV